MPLLRPAAHPRRAVLARRGWLLPLGLALLLALLGWGGHLLYQERERRYQHVIENGLSAINQVQVRSVTQWRQRRLGEAEALSDDAVLALAVARWQAEPTAEREARLRERLRGLVEYMQYAGAYLVDTQGTLLLASQGAPGGSLPESERRALAQALAQAQAITNGLQRNERFVFPYYGMLAPLFDGERPVGAIWLVMDARTTLYPLLEAWPGGSRTTAESLLARREGDEVVFLSPLRTHEEAALRQRLSLASADEGGDAMALAARGARGTLYANDYRGHPVLATVSAVPASDWLLVSKIDRAEAFADASRGGWLSLTVYVSLSLVLAGALALWWQWRAWRRERALKERLERNMHWLESAQRAASLGYFAYDAGQRRFAMSAMANAIFGLPPQAQMTLRQWIGLLHPDDREAMLNAHGQAMSERSALLVQYRIRPHGGLPLRWVEVRGEFSGPGDARAPASRMAGTVQDITERRQAEEQLERYRAALEAQVRIDTLTRLANRLALDERVALEWARAQRGGAPLALLMIDVDRFKAFNDTYGHGAGDRCLQAVAQALADGVQRAGDMVARYGGEEFAVLLAGADERDALAVAERLRMAVRALAIEHAPAGRDAGIVTISVGVASVRPAAQGAGAQELFERADAALYHAKRSGRDRSVVYGPQCAHLLHDPPDSLRAEL
ncbi:sensor domain-containing diguanylate cyclase [Melaminivora suipulveris]|uniref:diguanylate cyclase n=1 Tax=Melaminivora suipulveris TaxID=2109913 RepID=A0A2R3QDM8_9BURK|nr:diguanylate cyclase [Melaminivora suipulveris]AVO49784.1 sensor domain-containing diguanylate cyclase [Melaminivora suipulveris]